MAVEYRGRGPRALRSHPDSGSINSACIFFAGRTAEIREHRWTGGDSAARPSRNEVTRAESVRVSLLDGNRFHKPNSAPVESKAWRWRGPLHDHERVRTENENRAASGAGTDQCRSGRNRQSTHRRLSTSASFWSVSIRPRLTSHGFEVHRGYIPKTLTSLKVPRNHHR